MILILHIIYIFFKSVCKNKKIFIFIMLNFFIYIYILITLPEKNFYKYYDQ